MHLAGWKFTVCEGASRNGDWNILDVKIPNFSRAREMALRQYKPDSFVVDFSPLSNEQFGDSEITSLVRKWIPHQGQIFLRGMEQRPRQGVIEAGCRSPHFWQP